MAEDLDDDELRLVVKSLSITYDALTSKIERLHGRYREEAVSELNTCNSALTKVKAEQTARWSR